MTPALTITRQRSAPQTNIVTSKAMDMPEKTKGDTETPPLTLNVADMARELKTSTKTIQRMHLDGRLPAPIVIGSRTLRWSRDALMRWIAAGAPPREEFEEQQSIEMHQQAIKKGESLDIIAALKTTSEVSR